MSERFARDWWLDAGTTSTAGFITETELASCAVTAAKLNASAVTTAKIADSGVTTAKIAAANVTSEKASTNLQTRTVMLPFGKLTASSSGGWSSSYVVYQPIIPIEIQRVAIINLNNWENATADEFVLFRNSSSSVAGVTFTSTAIVAGTRTCAAAIPTPRVAADTLLTLKTNTSTCSVTTVGYVQLDYLSTA